jgi:carboxyl-terminal processing protease
MITFGHRARRAGTLAIVALLLAAAAPAPSAQAPAPPFSANDRYRLQGMLRNAYETVKKEYYDPTFHGLDWDARYKEYEAKMQQAASLNAGVTLVAAFLDGLRDSHTYFQPPSRSYRVDYGYDIRMIGDAAHIAAVRADTDAAAKLKPGDRVLAVNGGPITRETLRTMQYVLGTLSPQPSTRVRVRDAQGTEREVMVQTKVSPGRPLRDFGGVDAGTDASDLVIDPSEADRFQPRAVEVDGAMILRLPVFFQEDAEVDKLIAAARKHPALVLDLRGNPGGLVRTLRRFVGGLFDRDVVIGERVGRGRRSRVTASTRGDRAFTGRLVVLVDAASGSSAEILARVVQLESRGTVVGDRSAGAVMEARIFPVADLGDTLLFYGFAVTSADLIMKDGKSLERTGVTPDELRLPTAEDLAAGRDPALAHAVSLVGITIDPVKAGQLFAKR